MLLVCNDSGHDLSDALPEIAFEPLPPDTMSKHQPCNQGIFDASKTMHKRGLVTKMLEAFEERLDDAPH